MHTAEVDIKNNTKAVNTVLFYNSSSYNVSANEWDNIW